MPYSTNLKVTKMRLCHACVFAVDSSGTSVAELAVATASTCEYSWSAKKTKNSNPGPGQPGASASAVSGQALGPLGVGSAVRLERLDVGSSKL